MDFTIDKYNAFLVSLAGAGRTTCTFDRFLREAPRRAVILRHDVDLRPQHSLVFARLQHRAGMQGTYYFRAVPESWDERIIKEIAHMGHEIGYHYECLTTCRGDPDLAIRDFEKNLAALRQLAPVTTICMHGSPLSPHDSRDLWKTYAYRDFGLLGEPYLDLDFGQMAYLTDTGRRWDGQQVSVRDRIPRYDGPVFKTTDQIIEALRQNRLPDQVMFTFHPQRWTNNFSLWLKELTLQGVKNTIKRHFYVPS